MSRRAWRPRRLALVAFLGLGACVLLSCTAPQTSAQATSTPAAAMGWPQIALERFAAGFDRPTAIVSPGDGSGRLFIVEQPGRIRVLKGGSSSLFLDISDRVSCCEERGLLDVAFPPGYAITTFGEDEAGELYLADYNGGSVYHIAGAAPAGTP